jgi:aspartate dehydrogenase
MSDKPVDIGIAGLGTIGGAVLRALVERPDRYNIRAVTTRSHDKAEALCAELGVDIPCVSPRELAERAQIIVEAVPARAFLEIVEPAIERGRTIVTVSGGALLNHPDLPDRAGATGARLVLATGALLGLDAVRAAAIGTIDTAAMVTRKPPASLKTAAWVVENNIELDGLNDAKLLYEGDVREGCKRFPANVNVAAALSLAGIGPDRTQLQIWADPQVTRNTHTITVEADSARFTMTIENVPSSANPATGRITANSVLAALYGLTDPLKVGT